MATRNAGAVKGEKPVEGGPRRKGLEKFLASLDPKQLEALRREADRRRPDLKARPDVSALLREAVDDWLKRHVK